jgi:hypothetical protein
VLCDGFKLQAVPIDGSGKGGGYVCVKRIGMHMLVIAREGQIFNCNGIAVARMGLSRRRRSLCNCQNCYKNYTWLNSGGWQPRHVQHVQ